VQVQTHFHDCGMIPEAVQALQDAERVYFESAVDLRADLHKSFVFANAFLKRDAARARQWWERMEAKGTAAVDAEYWFTRSALLWVEGDLDGAEAALHASSTLMAQLPRVGAYDYDRDCAAQLQSAIAECCEIRLSA
jgi:hypothetical protein